MPKDVVAPRSRATANPAAARSRASSHEAARSFPLSRTSGSVSRTCLRIEHTFLGGQADKLIVAPAPSPEPPGGYAGAARTPGQEDDLRVQGRPVIAADVPCPQEINERKGGSLAGRTARRRVLRIMLPDGGRPGDATPRADFLAAEEPLGIRVDGAALAMTMRTPGDDIELAAGFLAGEAVIRSPADIADIKLCDGTSCG